MKSLVIALLTVASTSAQNDKNCPNFHSIVPFAHWKDITKTKNAFNIASNTKSTAVWITFDKQDASGNGYHIGKYNPRRQEWEETRDQPVGAASGLDTLAVDKDGDPAYIGFKQKHILFMKQGMWTEIGGCASGVAYGPQGTLYRRGCDGYIFQYEDEQAQWIRLGTRKAATLTASEEGVWITDKITRATFRWSQETQKFESKGLIKATDVAVGLRGQIVVRNARDDAVYTRQGQQWSLLTKDKVKSFAVGQEGRLFKIMEDGKILMQVANQMTEKAIITRCRGGTPQENQRQNKVRKEEKRPEIEQPSQDVQEEYPGQFQGKAPPQEFDGRFQGQNQGKDQGPFQGLNQEQNKAPQQDCGQKTAELLKKLFNAQEEKKLVQQKFLNIENQAENYIQKINQLSAEKQGFAAEKQAFVDEAQTLKDEVETLKDALQTMAEKNAAQVPQQEDADKAQEYSNQIVIETEKRISAVLKMNKMLTNQVERNAELKEKDQQKMNRFRIKTRNQRDQIERLSLAIKRRTKQNEKKLTIAQRKVIKNQYRKLNKCANTLFQTKANAERTRASFKQLSSSSKRSVTGSCDESETVTELTKEIEKCKETLKFDSDGQKEAIVLMNKEKDACQETNLKMQSKIKNCKSVSVKLVKQLSATGKKECKPSTCKKEKRMQKFYKYKYSKCNKNLKSTRAELEQATADFEATFDGSRL